MDNNFTLESVTQDNVNQAMLTLTSLIKEVPAYANLDLSTGTVLTDLLLRPQAELWSLEELRINFVTQMKSLQSMLDSGETIPVDTINDILSNFSTSVPDETKSSGDIIIKLGNNSDRLFTAGYYFTDPTGKQFITVSDYSFSFQPVNDELPIRQSADENYYMIVPVVAAEIGDDYMLKQGTPLVPSSDIFGMISCNVYADFSGASNAADLTAIIANLPAAISHRSLESRTSISSILTDPNFGGFTSIKAISVVGAGDLCQLRDKHNYIGASTFGRVDIYPRTFSSPTIVTLLKTGVKTGADSYEITIDADDAPGYYAVKSVTDADAVINPIFDFDTIVAIGSYNFEDTREADDILDTFHDISADNAVIETAYTKYQKGTLTVSGVTTSVTEERLFKVQVYCAPYIAEIQNYVDGTAVRNIKSDYIVRSPLMCLIGLRCTLDIPKTLTTTTDEFKYLIADHINNLSFVNKLSQSELVGLLISNGVKYVDLSSDATYGFKLEGRIRAADGSIVPVYGPDLVIPNVTDEQVLVAANTCVFAADVTNIFITLRKI